MRLNPGLHVVPIGGGTVLIGSGARTVQLTDCTPAVLQVLERLAHGVPDGTELELLRRCGVKEPAVAPLLSRLSEVLVPSAEQPGPQLGHLRDLLAADAAAVWARDGHADRMLERRSGSTVQVIGLGRTGAVVAQVLAAAGIGQLLLVDPLCVTVANLGTGYRSADLGRVRAVALSRRLDPEDRSLLVWPAVGVGPAELQGDLTVAVSLGALDRSLVAAARAADHPLLPVVVRDDDVVIGPWADPARPGCPECWDLWSTRTDPAQSDRTAALAGARAGWEETALSHAAGAMAAGQVLARVDAGQQAGASGHVLRLSATGQACTSTVEPHPDCGCLLAAAFS
ncbi:TOMM precursor leader peptide-binding protein [Micrococcus terreus]|uniref:TOMM precursor leader peptide-binding protein n=1 Tax=Micrococcus terreus TaxID=574650 RepID=UPI0033FC3848